MVGENLDPNRTYLNPEMETMPIEELRTLQLTKLQKQIKYCYENSPHYYKQKFDEAGAKPEDIKTLADWRKLPVMRTKEGDRESQKESLEREGHPFWDVSLCPPRKGGLPELHQRHHRGAHLHVSFYRT